MLSAAAQVGPDRRAGDGGHQRVEQVHDLGGEDDEQGDPAPAVRGRLPRFGGVREGGCRLSRRWSWRTLGRSMDSNSVRLLTNTVQQTNSVRLGNGVRCVVQCSCMALIAELPVPTWKRTRQASTPRPALTRDVIVDMAITAAGSRRPGRREHAPGRRGAWAPAPRRSTRTSPTRTSCSIWCTTGSWARCEVPGSRPGALAGSVPRGRPCSRSGSTRAHRDIARVSLAIVPTGPNALRIAEGMLAIMLAGGVPPKVAAFAAGPARALHRADAFEGTLYDKLYQESGQTREEFMESYFGERPGLLPEPAGRSVSAAHPPRRRVDGGHQRGTLRVRLGHADPQPWHLRANHLGAGTSPTASSTSGS